jgi:hypothetical protein
MINQQADILSTEAQQRRENKARHHQINKEIYLET